MEPTTPSQVPPSPLAVPAPIPAKNNLFVVIVVVILFLTLGVAGFFAYQYYQLKQQIAHTQPTPTPMISQVPLMQVNNSTANWKKYTNTTFHYEFSYPNNLRIDENSLKDMPNSVLLNVVTAQEFSPPGFPLIYVSAIPKGITRNDFLVYNFMPQDLIDSFIAMKSGEIKQTQTGTASEFGIYKKLPDCAVAGMTAGVTVENSNVWEGHGGLIDRRVFVKQNGVTFEIGTYYQSKEDLDSFTAFLSTFKFSDQTADMSTWKTYTNTKYDFSFKYPSSWLFKDVSAPGLDDQIWLAANSYSLPSGTYGGVGNDAQPPISFQISKNDLTAIGWAPEQWNNLTSMPYTVGNLQGTIKTGTSKEGLSKVTVISAKMGNVYINILPLEVTEKASLDQILSTFKFAK